MWICTSRPEGCELWLSRDSVCFLGWGGGAVGRLAGQKNTGGERLSYVLKYGVICSRGKGFPVCSNYSNSLRYSSDQVTFKKIYVFPHTKHSPVRSVTFPTAWFPWCWRVPACATKMWWERLSAISSHPNFPSNGTFQPLMPVAQGTEPNSKVGSHSWALTSFSWNKPFVQPRGSKLSLLCTIGRQNCYHSPNWADKQWPEGWEHVGKVSTLGKGRGGESRTLQSKEPLSAEISIGRVRT